MPRPPSALWLCHKPIGSTSAALVAELRDRLSGPYPLKVSHGGALDPFASGLVLLLVGAANRVFERLHEVPKCYTAEVAWGRETDTGDLHGATVGTLGGAPPAEALDEALARCVGWHAQVPPATSNKWVDGERAYQRAHRGEVVVLPPSRVYCHAARWVRHDLPWASTLEVSVRGGYYVRSLARDLGRALGCGAHLRALTRTAIGPWCDPPPGPAVQQVGADLLPWLPAVLLSDAEWGAVRRGAALPERVDRPPRWPLPPDFPAPTGSVAQHRGRLVAVGGPAGATLLPGGIG